MYNIGSLLQNKTLVPYPLRRPTYPSPGPALPLCGFTETPTLDGSSPHAQALRRTPAPAQQVSSAHARLRAPPGGRQQPSLQPSTTTHSAGPPLGASSARRLHGSSNLLSANAGEEVVEPNKGHQGVTATQWPNPCLLQGMEGEGISNLDGELREIFAEFMVGVIKFEELVEVGRTFLIKFQQAIEFLRRPSIHDSSELVKSIIKANETKRVSAYVEADCTNDYDSTVSVSQLHTSVGNLREYLHKTKGITTELQSLMDKAGNAILMNSDDSLVSEMELQGSEEVTSSQKLDAAGCASFMAVIYGMVKQEYTMQEKIVSSLNLKSASEELESYCQMWMLRPYINDDVIHDALKQVK